MKKKRALVAAVCLLLAAAVLTPYLIYENTVPEVSEYALGGEKLPAGFEGFTIAQVSDFHNSRSRSLRERLLAALEAAAPDVIVLTGDLIDARKTDVDTALSLTEALTALAPVYFVSGNHEALAPQAWEILASGLRARGVTLLENDSVTLERGGDTAALQGISDPKFLAMAQIASTEQVAAQLPHKKGEFRILLAHRPEAFDVYAAAGFDLILTGHAHGGQIRLPFIGGLYAPGQGWFPRYTAGVYRAAGSVMVVSRGIGNSVLPLRINNRPELVIVRLTKSETN